jgi:hypothetical protein
MYEDTDSSGPGLTVPEPSIIDLFAVELFTQKSIPNNYLLE